MTFVRVKGPDGSQFTVDEGAVPHLGVTVLTGKAAVDVNGRPLPAKPFVDLAKLGRGTVADIRQYASEERIDLGDAETKADMMTLIESAQNPTAPSSQES